MSTKPTFSLLCAAAALFLLAPATAAAAAGDLLVGANGDASVVRIHPDGSFESVASGGDFVNPSGLDLSPKGVIFVADYDAPGVVRADTGAATGVGLIVGPPFDEPLDLEFGPDGMIYVAEDGGDVGIYRVNPRTGIANEVATGAPFTEMFALVVTPSGRIFAADGNSTVYTIAPGASLATEAATIPGTSLQGIEQRPDGKLYVADSQGKIFLVDPATHTSDEVASDPLLFGQYNIALEPGGTLVSSGVSGGGIARINLASDTVSQVGSYNVTTEGVTVEPPRCGGKLATITGTTGRDVIRGSRFADVIFTFGGNDVVKGLAGKDTLCGAAGRDRLVGGKGADRLIGGRGRDRLIGGKGRDRLIGGPGLDVQAP